MANKRIIEPKDLPVISSLELVNKISNISKAIQAIKKAYPMLAESKLIIDAQELTKLPRAFNLD